MIVMKIGQLLILWGIQDGVAGVLTRLRAGWIGVQFPARQDIVPLLQSVQIASRAHFASCSVGTGGCLSSGKLSGVQVTYELHVVWRLRMSGAIPLFSLYVFKMWQGQLYPFFCTITNIDGLVLPKL
jgi:hypothetical protein